MKSERLKFIEDNDIKMNYTTIFLLPMLEYSKDFFKIKEFISSYIIDELKPKLVLIFEDNNDNEEDLKEILYCLQNHEEFVSIDKDDCGDVIVTFNIPERYNDDFIMFKKGKYSKFSNNYKDVLLDNYGRVTGNGKCIMMSDALFPNHLAKKYRADQFGVSINDLPNGEVMSIPNMDLELYWKVTELSKMKKYIVNSSDNNK